MSDAPLCHMHQSFHSPHYNVYFTMYILQFNYIPNLCVQFIPPKTMFTKTHLQLVRRNGFFENRVCAFACEQFSICFVSFGVCSTLTYRHWQTKSSLVLCLTVFPTSQFYICTTHIILISCRPVSLLPFHTKF